MHYLQKEDSLHFSKTGIVIINNTVILDADNKFQPNKSLIISDELVGNIMNIQVSNIKLHKVNKNEEVIYVKTGRN